MSEAHGLDLLPAVVLLTAGVVAVPLFKKIKLGSVLGYLMAGLLIGPFGLGLIKDSQSILHFAELGVVMFLFIIGLEMQPSKLWNLRANIFGIGSLQVAGCTTVLAGAGMLLGMAPTVALIAAAGFVLSSTAIVMQILEERGEMATLSGQRIVSILIFEDLSIVPLLALVAFLSPATGGATESYWLNIGIAIASVVGLLAIGRYLLNPMFRVLAGAKAREVMTAAALLVVLGSALLMQMGGLSMAMGAFIAGVMLSESSFRHQLETDIEPFRGILLGLFFLGVGMSLDLSVFLSHWQSIIVGTLVFSAVKSLAIYLVARSTKAPHQEALKRAGLLAQGGEFAFVLYAAASSGGIFDQTTASKLAAMIILSMALTPLIVLVMDRLQSKQSVNMEGVEPAEGLKGKVLLIGFGRFGQIVSQFLLSRGFEISIIETSADTIRNATNFSFKVYYGDGARVDILEKAGAKESDLILVCIDDRKAINDIVKLSKLEFPLTKVMVRAIDRQHSLELITLGVDYQMRETFESAMAFGRDALQQLGLSPEQAGEIFDLVRVRDRERLALQSVGGIYAGQNLIHSNLPKSGSEPAKT